MVLALFGVRGERDELCDGLVNVEDANGATNAARASRYSWYGSLLTGLSMSGLEPSADARSSGSPGVKTMLAAYLILISGVSGGLRTGEA